MNNELTLHIEYHYNGNVKFKGLKNSNGQQEGLWVTFYENGNIHSRTPYAEGEANGIEERFWYNGNIRMRTPYIEGKMDGIEERFDKRGHISETKLWKGGKLIEETQH